MRGTGKKTKYQELYILNQGHYTWNDGRSYAGEWKDNEMEGFGVYLWPDGKRYEGYFVDDKKHGYGIYSWADKRVYEGWWMQGKQHGLGMYKVPNKPAQYGVWECGKRIHWCNEQEIELIRLKNMNYRMFLETNSDKTFNCEEEDSFDCPKAFIEKQRNHVKLLQSLENEGKHNKS